MRTGTASIFPVLIVVAAVSFNAALAVVNGSVTPLSSRHVIVCEVLIVAAAQIYALSRFDARMLPWYALVVLAGMFALVRMAAVGTVDPKFLRDVVVIQTFVVLGLASSEQRALQAFLAVVGIVVAGILLEAVSLETYSSVFHVKDFYINTRGLASGEFTNEASDLYVSATRPEARYLPFFGLHRLSSVFLEPVSLGNFLIIMVAAMLAFWQRMPGLARVLVLASVVLALFASDGRLAMTATAAILGLALLSRMLPANVALTILPGVLVMAVLAVEMFDLQSGRDNFPGRLAYTAEIIGRMTVQDYLGLSDRLMEASADSGVVYLIITQSVVFVAAFWMLVSTGIEEDTAARRNYKNGVCVYLALTMLVSFSFVSIKTAAPLWFIYGALAAGSRVGAGAAARLPDRGPDQPVAPAGAGGG